MYNLKIKWYQQFLIYIKGYGYKKLKDNTIVNTDSMVIYKKIKVGKYDRRTIYKNIYFTEGEGDYEIKWERPLLSSIQIWLSLITIISTLLLLLLSWLFENIYNAFISQVYNLLLIIFLIFILFFVSFTLYLLGNKKKYIQEWNESRAYTKKVEKKMEGKKEKTKKVDFNNINSFERD